MRSEEIRAIHDLRMPAQMMTGCAEMLKCILEEGDEEARRYVDLLVQNGAELVNLLDQLMRAGRRVEDEPQAYLTVGDMAAATSALCGQAEPYARTKGLTLICVRPPHPVVTAFDSKRYARILMNLMSNAVKFTPAGGRVVVRLEQASQEIRLSVTDTGIGMPDHELQSLFEEGGAGGVGLSIVRKYTRLHGGRVTAARNLRGGMCFTVTFPIGAAETEALDSGEKEMQFSKNLLASGGGIG
ncbi:MAG: HAMP domain-containing sensor histidine kinase [Clostridia bacterium]|nr:HAMP domain-containing sensor histidine kinase [Clostridia bacterium]